MKELTVNTSKSYKIQIERGCLGKTGKLAERLFKPGAKAVLVSDSNVLPLYGERVKQSLEAAGFSVHTFAFPAGEESKQLSCIAQIYSECAKHRLTRSDFLVALGGGVTGDMTGFAAATYLRGIPFIQIPTSLLAQIDSSVGGKTAVDLPQGKNLVGAFHQPCLVLIDPDTLETLPQRFLSDGMAEAIKYGCIKSRELFDMIYKEDIRQNMEELIYRCVDIKREIVQRDEFDTGERMLLNFGHTFGHALEKLYGFSKLSHGEAVGIGMVMMAKCGESMGITKPGTTNEIIAALRKFQLPTSDPMPIDQILSATAFDKKNSGGMIGLILLKQIGEGFVDQIYRDRLAELTEVLQ
ncbi:3-dehydroquinate synthase [Caproiciproducens galactitolivorans]|uniref:3-dehydroquinate synthase n=1 Tax=Caproiciproducens galactitolivorans TaxID=642589 RepID=A0A4Z0YD29_9FIRM|nr:3-dehydroquinate synthase [Caproiciproducens galactitolivorans]QEY35607.1 3-dehydroquinate synthase [Caproiciproducens galactitolivorans]TGJ77335.1 3-dehydroquinate synthase [Caproiciproducens galactitolivorans]